VDGDLTDAQTDVLIDVLLDSADMSVFLQRLVHISSRKLQQSLAGGHCSVTVLRDRRPVTVCSSDPETAVMDEVQYASKRGPCLEAVLKGLFVEVADLRSETRWPRYVRAMAGSPMRSVLAVPIPLKTRGGAALNTYSHEPGPVAEDVRRALLELADVAGRAVTLSVKLQTQAEKSADLAAALESRTAIDLASGVIMAQTGCSQKEAVNVLMKASSNRNEKLRDVALSVISRFNGAAPSTHFDSPS
jgi:ANTAR domain